MQCARISPPGQFPACWLGGVLPTCREGGGSFLYLATSDSLKNVKGEAAP